MKLVYLFISKRGISISGNSSDICFNFGNIVVGIAKRFVVLNSRACLIGFIP